MRHRTFCRSLNSQLARAPRRKRLPSTAAFFAAAICSGCGFFVDLPTLDDAGEGPSVDGGSAGESALGSGGRRSLGGGGAADANLGGEGSGGSDGPGAGGYVPGSCVTECDCDEDGYLSEGSCGGDDCDDEDARVHPGQTKYYVTRSDNESIGYDFNCSGQLERDPKQGVKIDCSKLSLGGCGEVQGFHDVLPACGQTGSWGSCSVNVLVCAKTVLDSESVARCH